MLYIKVPTGVTARSSPCNLDVILEMSGLLYTWVVNGYTFPGPAPKIWMRGQRKIQMFWLEHYTEVPPSSVPILQTIFVYICASWSFQYAARHRPGAANDSLAGVDLA